MHVAEILYPPNFLALPNEEAYIILPYKVLFQLHSERVIKIFVKLVKKFAGKYFHGFMGCTKSTKIIPLKNY